MQKIVFSCTVENSSDSEDLGLELWMDDYIFFNNNIKKGLTPVSYIFDEDDSTHRLKVVLKNKTIDHTTIDDSGTIITDSLISIKNICFDEINIDQLFFENAVYTHNYNGSGPDVEEQFYGHLGCNGTVTLEFYTPFYMWLLENM